MQTLVISQSYEPVKIVSWQRALTLLFLGKVEVLESYEDSIRSPSYAIKAPSVVRLLQAFRRVKKAAKFSRINIYARDGYRCQYCGIKLLISEGTYDHVIPRAQGGKTEWTNIVTCGEPCNSRKSSRTPEQAGMKLKKQPTRPEWTPSMIVRLGPHTPESWRDYVYWAGELEQD